MIKKPGPGRTAELSSEECILKTRIYYIEDHVLIQSTPPFGGDNPARVFHVLWCLCEHQKYHHIYHTFVLGLGQVIGTKHSLPSGRDAPEPGVYFGFLFCFVFLFRGSVVSHCLLLLFLTNASNSGHSSLDEGLSHTIFC